MAYDEELDARDYDMIYTLFYGAEEEEERRREAEGQETPCDCRPAVDGIAVRILKFIFGERTLVEDNYEKDSERRPYHQHIQQPAHSHSNHPGARNSSGSKRWNRKRLPQYPMLAEDTDMATPGGALPHRQVENLLRLFTTVLCAAAVIVFGATMTQLSKIKNWLWAG